MEHTLQNVLMEHTTNQTSVSAFAIYTNYLNYYTLGNLTNTIHNNFLNIIHHL